MSSSFTYTYLITTPDLRPLKAFHKKYGAKHWRETNRHLYPKVRIFTGNDSDHSGEMQEKPESYLYE